jgi:hypothetical protein
MVVSTAHGVLQRPTHAMVQGTLDAFAITPGVQNVLDDLVVEFDPQELLRNGVFTIKPHAMGRWRIIAQGTLTSTGSAGTDAQAIVRLTKNGVAVKSWAATFELNPNNVAWMPFTLLWFGRLVSGDQITLTIDPTLASTVDELFFDAELTN